MMLAPPFGVGDQVDQVDQVVWEPNPRVETAPIVQ